MFDTIVRNYRSWRKYNATYNELMRLSTHELNDLGISRADIPYIARRSSH